MSGLALWYKNLGWQVNGSDVAESPVIDMLRRFGIEPEITNDQLKNIPRNVDLIIHTQAIDRDKITNTPGVVVKNYPEALGELAKEKFTIAVCGTHGKSTTTAMAGLLLVDAGFDPTVLAGTMLREFANSNFNFGHSKYLVIEADEFKGAFLNYYPDVVIWTNADSDHLDYFKDFADILGHFKAFVRHVPENGFIVANCDDKNIIKTLEGFKNSVFYSLRDKEAKKIRGIIKVPGEHNVSNALAVLKLARVLHIPDDVTYGSISNFHGSWRRFEFKGEINGAKVYDDYAHHPTEIKATLAGARAMIKKGSRLRSGYGESKIKIWAVFQPHQFERTKLLFKEFARAFKGADKVILLDVYGVKGRENKVATEVSSEKLAKAIAQYQKNVFYKPGIADAADYIKKTASSEDIIIIMGAGDIWKIFGLLKLSL